MNPVVDLDVALDSNMYLNMNPESPMDPSVGLGMELDLGLGSGSPQHGSPWIMDHLNKAHLNMAQHKLAFRMIHMEMDVGLGNTVVFDFGSGAAMGSGSGAAMGSSSGSGAAVG